MVYIFAMSTLVVLNLLILVSSTDEGVHTPACVTSFSAFEKAVLADDGNVEALIKVFYEANRPLPLYVEMFYHVNSSNGTDTISTDHSCPPRKEVWLWVPSPMFILIEPAKLNIYALYTLNYFRTSNPRKVHIFVPNVCNISLHQYNFLNDFTMRVQMYAAANLSSERGYLGYVIRGCGTSPFKRETFATLPDNDSHLETIVQTMVCFYIVGTTLLIILILLGSGLFLHKCKKESIMDNGDSTAECSHDNYGLLWGLVTMSLLGNVLLTAHGIYIVYLHLTSGVFKLIAAGWMMLGQMVFEIIASLTVGIYYGRKLNFMVPSIFLLPVTFICCCHAKETSKKIVQCLSIWSLLMFILHVCYRASFLFLALLARPPVVISTALLIIFAAFYFVHLLAILFTFTKVRKRQQRKRYVYSLLIDLVQTVAVMVVFATAICFGSVIGFVGMLANYGTIMNNPYSMLSTLITPLALAGFGWALRKVGAEWLRSVTSPNTAEQDEIVPLLQEPKQRVSVNPKAGGDQMRKSTLMSCLMQ